MNHSRLTAQRLVALFLLGCLLFNFPLLALFNRGGEVFGIPVLYAYLFGVWLTLIGLMAFVAERRH
jgi:predicted permease